MMDGFSFETLTSLSSYKKRIAYCKQMLGQPIGNGSSRIVFQISDERVLKVAKNQKGIAQNEAKWIYISREIFRTNNYLTIVLLIIKTNVCVICFFNRFTNNVIR